MKKLKGEQFTTLGFNIPNLLKYDEDGCMDFIPVKVIEVNEDRKCLKVEVVETGLKVIVPNIYRFEKKHEPQKVVVPKFVAEWIKKYKEMGFRLSHALEKVFDDVEVGLYIKQQEGDYTETITKAWIDGYEVEKEVK